MEEGRLFFGVMNARLLPLARHDLRSRNFPGYAGI
jgi:hypothetical protein